MPEVKKSHRCFAGEVKFLTHESRTCAAPMNFSLFQPDKPSGKALIWLSGLTCTEENFITKAGAIRAASELGMILLCPDTSPRGLEIPGVDDSYDFGSGAGFYVDATTADWQKNYRMYSYVTEELPALMAEKLGVPTERLGISGHSMGGHGALVCGLRNPELFKSISAFAPICAPIESPWGRKAFAGYLGEDESTWQHYDASRLVKKSSYQGNILIDQGEDDEFLKEQLKPHLLKGAAEDSKVKITYRAQKGFDHSYYFISTFIEDHLRFHSEVL